MDSDSFSDAVRENEDRIRAYITRMIGSEEEADDLTQETFVRAHAGWADFRGESKLSTWLYSIATHVSLDYLKSAGRRRLKLIPPEELAEVMDGQGTGGEARLSPLLLLDQAEMGESTRRYVDELPSEQRMALVLHDIEGMTNAEVAEALGCSVAAAKTRLHRARKHLRGVLEKICTLSRDARGILVCEPIDGCAPPTS